MDKEANKEAGYGAIIIFVIAALALTLFLSYFKSLNENDSVRQLALSASGIKNLAINNVGTDLDTLRNKTQASIVALMRRGDANVGDAITGLRSSGTSTDFNSITVDTTKGDVIFLGFVSPTGAKSSTTIPVIVTGITPDGITGTSGNNLSIGKRVLDLQQQHQGNIQ